MTTQQEPSILSEGLYEVRYDNGMVQYRNLISKLLFDVYGGGQNKEREKRLFGEYYFTTNSPLYEAMTTGIVNGVGVTITLAKKSTRGIISETLRANGWTGSIEDGKFFRYSQGKALYVYPNPAKIIYWPDIRAHSLFHEHQFPITEDELLELIKKE